MFPLTHLFEQAEDVLGLSTFQSFEWMILFIVLIRERNDVIFDFAQHGRIDIKGNLKLIARGSMVVIIAQIGDLQLDLTEFGDDIVKAIAEDWIVFMLIDLQVQLLKKFVFSFDELLLADAEKNGDL